MSEASRWDAPAELGRLERRLWMVGGAGAAHSLVGALLDRAQFLQSYLVSWLLWTGVAFGCLAVMALHHLSGGAWGLMIRRLLEAAAKTIPLLGLLMLPILLGLEHIYPWAEPEAMAAGKYLQQQTGYLRPAFFALRALGYFVILGGLAWLICRWSLEQDRTADAALYRKMRGLAGPTLGIYVLVVTLAAVDWIMSLDPLWYSSLFGVYFLGGHAVSAFAFVILAALWLARREPMSGAFSQRHFHDYGKLLFAFVMLWAYFAVSQLLIIWSGNLAEEVTWYLERVQGGWKVVGVLLAFLHFALPFLLLLSRDLKRDAKRLAVVAGLLLVMRWVDLYWQVGPAFHHDGFSLHWLDLTTLAGLGGLWLATVLNLLGRHPLLPVNAADLQEALPGD